jgi:hypothetical protein
MPSSGNSVGDRILATRPVGETYVAECNGHRLHFRKEGNNQYQDLNKPTRYSSVNEILKQQSFEVHGYHTGGVSNRPNFITIKSGPNRDTKLNTIRINP